jgi:hypothetical protein
VTTPPAAIDSAYTDGSEKTTRNGTLTGTHLASGYKREKVQTGSIVRNMLPSLDVMMTSENPSGFGCESIWTPREESRSQRADVCGKVRAR